MNNLLTLLIIYILKEEDKTTGPRSLSKNELITEIERNWKYEES